MASLSLVLMLACILEVAVAMIIAASIGGGYGEVNFSCGAFGCTDEATNTPRREPPPLLEAVFGVPLLLAPGLIGAVPAVVRSFSSRVGFLWLAVFSSICVILGFVLYFVVGALLFIGILRYVLDPSLLPEIILFPLALLPIPWVVDRVVRILLS